MKQAIRPSEFPFFDYGRYAFSLGVQAGDSVWLAGQSASRYDAAADRIVAGGSPREQAAIVQAKQRLLLEAAGLGFSSVVKRTDYITPAGRDAYDQDAAERLAPYAGSPPAVSTVVVRGLLRPEALIETEVVATRAERRPVHAGVAPERVAAMQAGDLLYCSLLGPVNPETGTLPAGDFLDQAEQIYHGAARLLAEAGYSMAEVVKTVDYIHPSALEQYRETWRVRAAHLGAPGSAVVAATGIIMPELSEPGALLQVEFTACHGPKEALNPGWERYGRLTYAPAVLIGPYCFVSGQLALNPESNQPEFPGDIAGQARYIYGHIQQTLAAAGLSMESIVKTVEYVAPAGLASYRATAAVRREFFQEPYPAATGVVCEALLRPECLLEVECVAVNCYELSTVL